MEVALRYNLLLTSDSGRVQGDTFSYLRFLKEGLLSRLWRNKKDGFPLTGTSGTSAEFLDCHCGKLNLMTRTAA